MILTVTDWYRARGYHPIGQEGKPVGKPPQGGIHT